MSYLTRRAIALGIETAKVGTKVELAAAKRLSKETSALPTGEDIDKNFKTTTAITEILDRLSKDEQKLLVENLDVTMKLIKDFAKTKKATYKRK